MFLLGDGNWSTAVVWSECDKTCGFGQKARSRTCNNPLPYNGGKYCEGSAFVFAPCNEFHCPSKLHLYK